MKKLITLLVIIAIVLVLSPKIVGIYLEKQYRQLIQFNNSQAGSIQTEIQSYQNGWFSSDAVLKITLKNPNVVAKSLKMADNSIPPVWITQQHLQHGPIFYRPLTHLHSFFGLATIQNAMVFSSDITAFLKQLGIPEHFVTVNEGLIGFNGSYTNYLKTAPLSVLYPGTQLRIQVNGIEAEVTINATTKRIKGRTTVQQSTISDAEDTLTMPEMVMTFDQYQSPELLWVGDAQLKIASILWREVGGKSLSITGIEIGGNSQVTAGLLSVDRKFDVEQIQWEKEKIGPFHLHFSLNKLDAKAISNMIATYRDVMQQGELYQSQLQRKLAMMFPAIIRPGSNIVLDTLSLKTSTGDINAKGKVAWPEDSTFLPEDLLESIQAVDANAEVRIGKKLVDRFITLAAGFSNSIVKAANGVPPSENAAMELRKSQISALVQQGALSEITANHILTLQNSSISPEQYAVEVKKMVDNKELSAATANTLTTQYAAPPAADNAVQAAATMPSMQPDAEKQMHDQLQAWVSSGFIVVEGDDYVVRVIYKKGKLTVNDKPM